MTIDQTGAPSTGIDAAGRHRAMRVRVIALVLTLIGFAALLYAMTVVRLIT